MLMGTISGVLSALGMCMVLIPEWNAFQPGIIFGFIGLVLGLITIWFITMCAYYIVLSTMRLSAVLCERKNRCTSHTMNTLTGSAVCLFVLILGISLIIRGAKRKENNYGYI